MHEQELNDTETTLAAITEHRLSIARQLAAANVLLTQMEAAKVDLEAAEERINAAIADVKEFCADQIESIGRIAGRVLNDVNRAVETRDECRW